MTMHNAPHPDDERLAAYASADREAVSDRELASHIASCERCRPIVDELTMLRDALALLPDLPPSRPLRLIPPVADREAPRAGALEWLRRLAAPAMAAGAGLVLIGAVGASGLVNQVSFRAVDASKLEASGSDSAHAPDLGGLHSTVPAIASSREYSSQSNEPGSQAGNGFASPTPNPAKGISGPPSDKAEQPWLTLLIAGFGLFGISAVLRYSLTPRAG